MHLNINVFSTFKHNETYLSESVAVSLSSCRDNNLLSPVPAIEVLKVFLDTLQPRQFSGEVNRCNTRVVWVPVQRFLQSLVDLMQRAQEELKGRSREGVRRKGDRPQNSDWQIYCMLPCTEGGWRVPSGSSASAVCFLLWRDSPSSSFWFVQTDRCKETWITINTANSTVIY